MSLLLILSCLKRKDSKPLWNFDAGIRRLRSSPCPAADWAHPGPTLNQRSDSVPAASLPNRFHGRNSLVKWLAFWEPKAKAVLSDAAGIGLYFALPEFPGRLCLVA